MNNLNGNRKNEFRRKQEEKQRKLALKIEDEAGELREGSLKSEEAIPSLDELCAIGERVEQLTTFSAKETMRNKIKARRDAERYKTTSTDSEKWTPNPFEDSNAAAIESPKNEDTLNTTRKHADAQSTKSAGLKTSKRRSIVEIPIRFISVRSCLTVQEIAFWTYSTMLLVMALASGSVIKAVSSAIMTMLVFSLQPRE